MTFLVVGHLCLDVIHPVDEPEIRSYGGIYYAMATLASLAVNGDRVVPVFGVNTNDYEPLIRHLKKFPNVDTSGVFTFDEPTNNVHLFYQTAETRIECSKDISKPIPFQRIKGFLKADGVLVNMISGFDITLNTLDEIRMAVREQKIPIHFDYHSLTLGVQENHERFRRPVSDWRRWAFMIDTVQLNEEEIAGLPLEPSTEQQTVGHLLTLGVHGLVVTRGERGATLFTNEHKKVIHADVTGRQIERSRDATGCGDVFGAAFHLHYVKTHDLLAATEFANRVAAAKAQMSGSDDIQLLRTVV
ncbi:MAG: carbohydrate kinase family protein [Ignavibacteriae bacterium]|nr:carbohydrate kinase family protein [Ignavibacteriota bacterium]